jgi:6,7-dimethyl-8-ribityllumazine synthase
MTGIPTQGMDEGSSLRVAVIASRFNTAVVDGLVQGALDALARSGVAADCCEVVRVPGAFELLAAARRALRLRYDAVVCLGAIVRGETPHYKHLADAVCHGLADLARESDVPLAFGVLTTDTAEQAFARSAANERNKGAEAAEAALEMVQLLRKWGGNGRPPSG